MMFRTTAAALLALTLAQTAAADRFYFDDHPDRAIEGVLLAEEDGMYRIRIEGGTIAIPKESVVRIEQTDLTVADIEAHEKDHKAELAQANLRRRELHAAAREAEMARLDEIAAQEASTRPEPPQPIEVIVQPPLVPVYDPVLDVVRPRSGVQAIDAVMRGALIRATHGLYQP